MRHSKNGLITGLLLVAGCQAQVGTMTRTPDPTLGQGRSGDELRRCLEATEANPVDLLFVIDNSNSMQEEQRALAERAGDLIARLAAGDADGDGELDFPPVTDLRVGVITPDLGAGNYGIFMCEELTGDDGILLAQHDIGDYANAADFAAAVAATMEPGTDGCGFEMPLEALHRALLEQPENAGFLRPDSVLGVVVLTDEDDCSADDASIFDPTDFVTPLEGRCDIYRDRLWDTDQLAEIVTMDGRTPDQLVFTVIAGIPVEALGTGYDGILADPKMSRDFVAEEERDETLFYINGVRPSCSSASGQALAPRRLVEAARKIDGIEDADGRSPEVMLRSVCEPEMGLGELLRPLGRTLAAPCAE